MRVFAPFVHYRWHHYYHHNYRHLNSTRWTPQPASQYDHHLGSVVHDLIGELRLSDVLPELLDPRASRLGWAVLVDHLIGEHHGDDDDEDDDLGDCNSKFTLSHSLLAASPSGRMPHSSLITCTWFTKIQSMYFLLNFFSSLGGGDSKLSYKATFPRSSQSRWPNIGNDFFY